MPRVALAHTPSSLIHGKHHGKDLPFWENSTNNIANIPTYGPNICLFA
jgi:hypothetical protein